MLSRILCLENGCTLLKLCVNRGVQKNNNALMSIKKNSLKKNYHFLNITLWSTCGELDRIITVFYRNNLIYSGSGYK